LPRVEKPFFDSRHRKLIARIDTIDALCQIRQITLIKEDEICWIATESYA